MTNKGHEGQKKDRANTITPVKLKPSMLDVDWSVESKTSFPKHRNTL